MSSIPATSASPNLNLFADGDRHSLALDLALQIEGGRRTYTLGGGLLCIPLAAGIATAISAAIGLPLFWLPLCALLGSALGPALMTALFAFSNVIVLPMVKKRHLLEGKSLGLSAEDCAKGFEEAVLMLEEKTRRRLMRGREGARDGKSIPH